MHTLKQDNVSMLLHNLSLLANGAILHVHHCIVVLLNLLHLHGSDFSNQPLTRTIADQKR